MADPKNAEKMLEKMQAVVRIKSNNKIMVDEFMGIILSFLDSKYYNPNENNWSV